MKLLRKTNRTLATDLETERFVLRSLNAFSALRLTNRWRHDPEITGNFFRNSRSCSLYYWIRNGPIPDNVSCFSYAIIPKGQDRAIGIHAVRIRRYRTGTLTVAIPDRDWRGKDVVVEVRTRLISHFFEHSIVERFIGCVNARNLGSVFNYQRLGFTHVGTLHGHFYDPGLDLPIDVLNFELFADEFEKSG